MGRDIVVIGGSAGALDPLRDTIAVMRRPLAATVFIVIHTGSRPSQLVELLRHVTDVPIAYARTGKVRPGCVYVAPPDVHLLVGPGRIELFRGPRYHFTRPAIDPLFETASASYRERVIGILLSGGNNDGAAGLAAVKRRGGIAVVQDPDDCERGEMTMSALSTTEVDFDVRSVQLPALLQRLLADRSTPVKRRSQAAALMKRNGEDVPAAFICPDCGGALREEKVGKLTFFHCHTGHRITAEELVPAQKESMETALWIALRTLKERAELCDKLARRADGQNPSAASHWKQQEAEARRNATTLRDFLHKSANGDAAALMNSAPVEELRPRARAAAKSKGGSKSRA